MKNISLILGVIGIISPFLHFYSDYNHNSQSLQDGEPSLSFMLIGDYGTGDGFSEIVAEKFNEVAEQEQSEFVIGTGDNFYDPDGVNGIDDPSWDTKWADIYQNKSYLKNLNWYGVLGNHDWNGEDLYAEFQYTKHNWVIEDFFWAHTKKVGDQNIAFIHIDTNFLAYGKKGQDNRPLMKTYFKQLGWKDDAQMLEYVEQQLQLYENYDWIFVVGHHYIGYSCPPERNTGLLYPLLQKYNVDIYMSGHKHCLSYSEYDNMGFLLSGAGGYAKSDEKCLSAEPIWSKGKVFGFMSVKISGDEAQVVSYYQDSKLKKKWKSKELPVLKRRQK